MLKTLSDLQTEVLVRGNYDTTLAFITQTTLDNWIDRAHKYAAAFKKYPFTEKRDSSDNTSTSSEEHAYPTDFKSDSIRILTVGGKRLQKINFDDYLRFKEENGSASDRIFADFNRTYFINPNIDISGTIVAYGQYLVPTIDATDNTAITVFSNHDEDGNDAIVEKVLSYASQREGKLDDSKLHSQNADALLSAVWDRVAAEQFGYQAKGEGMWERIDVVEGNYNNELRRDQF